MLLWACGCIYLFELVLSYSLDKYIGIELFDHMVHLFLIVWGISVLFSIVAAPIYIPNNSIGEFSFLHTLSSICYLDFNDSHSDQCSEVVPHCSFNLYFSNN